MLTNKELDKKTNRELLKMISELKGKLLALRFEHATGQLTETHLIKATKKDIARIFTTLKKRDDNFVVTPDTVKDDVKTKSTKKTSSKKTTTKDVEQKVEKSKEVK